MEYRCCFFAGIILILVNIFGTSICLVNSTTVSNSSEVIETPQIFNCRRKSAARYQCVKIEDCPSNVRQYRGSRKFCKWDGKPTHVCCPQYRAKRQVKPLQTRQKRHDDRIYFIDDDYSHSSWFNHRNYYDWNDEDGSWETPWTVTPRHFPSRFGGDRDYNDDWDRIDDSDSRNSFDSRREPECGILEEEERGKILAAAVGGSPVRTAASSPWMAAIGHRQRDSPPQWFCGGVLVSRKIVITAAHCITKRKANLVRVGELDFTSETDEAEPQDSEIESSVIHPDHQLPRHYHDIAIIRLKTPVRYTKYVRPICLPPNNRNFYEDARVTLTGWGNVEYGGESSPILQEVQIKVISNSECNSRYGDPITARSNARTLPRGIINSQLCAGDENGGRDACQGDSGGPIVKREGRRRIVVGLVSSGLGCGSKFYPGIYTRVSYYSDWIRSFL